MQITSVLLLYILVFWWPKNLDARNFFSWKIHFSTNEIKLKTQKFSIEFVFAVIFHFFSAYITHAIKNRENSNFNNKTHQLIAFIQWYRFRTIVPWLIWVLLFEINVFANGEIKALYEWLYVYKGHALHCNTVALEKCKHNGQIIKRILSNKQ